MAIVCDLLIKGGTIVDGSGSKPYQGDVAVKGDKIVAIGEFEAEAAREIDASGRIVTPGFVDIHTHYDGQAIWSDRLSPSSSHGVTTVVMGNCGVGFAPCRPDDRDKLIEMMEGVEDIPDVVMAKGLPWTWQTFPEYMDTLDKLPHDIDVAAYLPHAPLRVYVMGERGINREPATEADMEKMRALSREAMEVGALGIATSRIFVHRTSKGELIPTYDAGIVEMRAIAKGMADAGHGIIQMVLNFQPMADMATELELLIDLVEESGRPATFTLGTSNDGERYWLPVLKKVEEANARGLSVKAQVLPRPVGLMGSFALSTNPFSVCPSYQDLHHLPFEERIERLRDPALREKLINEPPSEGHPLAMMARRWEWMFPFGDDVNYEPGRETSIAAQAAATGRTPEEISYDYLLTNGGRAMLYNTLSNYYDNKLDALYDLMRHPDVVVGLGDGGAHYSAICDASYPTFMLAYWARDRQGEQLSIEEAVRQLSALPAKAVGLDDRGLLAVGYKADINVINHEELRLYAPVVRHDLPAKGRRLDQTAKGYEVTIVSGELIRENDAPTAARPGRLVRGAQPMPAVKGDLAYHD